MAEQKFTSNLVDYEVVFYVGPPGSGRATQARASCPVIEAECSGLKFGRERVSLPIEGTILITGLDRALVYGDRSELQRLGDHLKQHPNFKLLATTEHRHLPVLLHFLDVRAAVRQVTPKDHYRENLEKILGEDPLEKVTKDPALIKQYSHEALEAWLAEQRIAELFALHVRDARDFARKVGQSYSQRRGLRSWLEHLLVSNQSAAFRVFEAALRSDELPPAYRRDIFDSTLRCADTTALLEHLKWDLLAPNREFLKRFVRVLESVSWVAESERQEAMWRLLLQLIRENFNVFGREDKYLFSDLIERSFRCTGSFLPSALDITEFLLTQTKGSLPKSTHNLINASAKAQYIPRTVRTALLQALEKRHPIYKSVFHSQPFDEQPGQSQPPAKKREKPLPTDLQETFAWTSSVLRGEASADFSRLEDIMGVTGDLESITLLGHSTAILIRDFWEECNQRKVIGMAHFVITEDSQWSANSRNSESELAGDRQVAAVIPKLFGREAEEYPGPHYKTLLPAAICHPNFEVRRMVSRGIANYLTPQDTQFWRCLRAIILLDRRSRGRPHQPEERSPRKAAAQVLREFWSLEADLVEFMFETFQYHDHTLECLDLALAKSGTDARELLKLPQPEIQRVKTKQAECKPEGLVSPSSLFELLLLSIKDGNDVKRQVKIWAEMLDLINTTQLPELDQSFHLWEEMIEVVLYQVKDAPRNIRHELTSGWARKFVLNIKSLDFPIVTTCDRLEDESREDPLQEYEHLVLLLDKGLGLPPFLLRRLETLLLTQLPQNPAKWKREGTPSPALVRILVLMLEAGSSQAGWLLDDYVTTHIPTSNSQY